MPRLLSSYAANKRVEDGLTRKQEQIRQDYKRATHRYLDETDKLVDELIQIHVRTPSVLPITPTGSASSQHRRAIQTPNNQPTPGNDLSTLPPRPGHPVPEHHPFSSRSRSRGGPAREGTISTEDGTSLHKREIPPPIVQVRGKEVFYQYNCHPKTWKKLEPTYKTKVLLHRNNTVSRALQQFTEQRKQMSERMASAGDEKGGPGPNHEDASLLSRRESAASSRRESMSSRRASTLSRRESMFSRRGSRRASRFYNDDDDDDDDDEMHRIPAIVELKPQLSPGHTPRMLDGFTIMNWCLWKKEQKQPVWASKRYMEKKQREFRRFQASRSIDRAGSDLPVKPSSAHASSREARRKSSILETEARSARAKSVPLQRDSTTLEEVEEGEEEEEEEEGFPEVTNPDKCVLRPTTSILRTDKTSKENMADESRPKTTQPRRRVALDILLDHDLRSRTSNNVSSDAGLVNAKKRTAANIDNGHDNEENNNNQTDNNYNENSLLKLRPKAKSVSLNENPQVVAFDNAKNPSRLLPEHPISNQGILEQPVDKKALLDRMPGLAATRIAVQQDHLPQPPTPFMTEPLRPSQQINVTRMPRPLMPKVKALVPELGTDSPR